MSGIDFYFSYIKNVNPGNISASLLPRHGCASPIARLHGIRLEVGVAAKHSR